CIFQGHRTSYCDHRDRILFIVNKKGRPLTQCKECRELRISKRIHKKCLCPSRKTI
ncbi:uncharacterized protein BX663DRAFT_406302, partial [Cokeromyces recurvatus]|uniref:uncharacterized protein n=1 Tax=Cokeromyces recurvatus TaxID=90255 RepID=UPI00221FB29C